MKLKDYLYYETDLGKLYCGDCLEILPLIDDKVDLVLTDQPYGIGESGKKNHSRGVLAKATQYKELNWDKSIPEKAIFDLIFEKSKNQIIFGGNYMIEHLKNSSCWLVWDKNNGQNDFADCELAWTNFKSAIRKYKFRWNGMLQENMKEKEKRYHPTQKPAKLFEKILDDYSEKNITVLDPFAGSGTTAIACINTGRKFILIEKEKEYCDIIVKRLTEHLSQTTLLEFLT